MSKKSATDSLDAKILQIVKNRKPQSVSQLIALVKEQIQISENQALDQIVDLENRGKIRLTTEPLSPSLKLSSYLKTSQARWYWITIVFALFTLVAVWVVPENLSPWSYVRIILGTIFVLYLPGFTLIKTLFPAKVPFELFGGNYSYVGRFTLSLGMSLAIDPIIGLLLNYSPWGMRLVPVVVSLFIFSIIFASTAIVSEYKIKTKTQIVQNVKSNGR